MMRLKLWNDFEQFYRRIVAMSGSSVSQSSHRRIAADRRALERQLVGIALVERERVADQPLIAARRIEPDEMGQAGGLVHHETLRPPVVPGRIDVAHRTAAHFPGSGMQASLDLPDRAAIGGAVFAPAAAIRQVDAADRMVRQ